MRFSHTPSLLGRPQLSLKPTPPKPSPTGPAVAFFHRPAVAAPRFAAPKPPAVKPRPPVAAPKPRPPAPVPAPPKPAARVLLIGNNYCGTANELAGCAADVDHARAWFVANTPPAFALSFYELSDRKGSGYTMAGPQGSGTGANILAGLAWLVAAAKAGDVMYVHYSGHGAGLATTDLAETSRVQSTWVPLDYQTFRGGGVAGLLQDDELRTKLVLAVPAGARLWVTSDSCFSGTVLDLRFNYTDASFRGLAPIPQAGVPAPWTPALPLPEKCPLTAAVQYDPRLLTTAVLVTENRYYAASAGTVVLLSGCTDWQTSADAFEEGSAQGALSWALFSALANAPTEPVKYLLKDVRALLVLHGYSQKPQLSSGKTQDLSKSFKQILFGG